MGLSMSEPLYLILHKVRGEAAFDIATPLEIGDEEGWIIPTSGHRAYPLTWWNMNEIGVREPGGDILHVLHNDYPDWEQFPDHYTTHRPESAPSGGGLKELLGIIGLGKPSVKAVRGLR